MHQYKLHFLVIFLFTSVPIKALEKHNLNIFFEFPVKNSYEMEFIENVKLIKIQDIKAVSYTHLTLPTSPKV